MVDPDTPLPSGWLPPKPPTQRAQRPAPQHADAWRRHSPRPAEPSSPAAVFALVVGIASIVLTMLTLGLAFALSVLLSALSLLIATRLRHAIRAGRPGREGQAKAAVVVGWIGLVLGAVAAVVWIGLSLAGVTPQEVQDLLQREVERQRARG